MPAPAADRLRPWERAGLAGLALLLTAFGALVVARSAFMANPKTDFQCYARAAWAVRTGADIYDVVDNNGWHYAYPPPFAVLLAPLADPYPFLPRDGYLPFAASVGVWYVVSLLCLGYAVHAFAGGVLPHLERGSRAWWYARLIPVYVCLGTLGHTLGRGQVNTVVLALWAAGFAAVVRGARAAGGAWLASAAVLKIIPALLVLFPLARRDWRGLAGAAAAVVLLIGVVPAAVWGVDEAVRLNAKVVRVVLGPVFSADVDQTRAKEMHGVMATDNQSVQAAAQAWLYPDRETRPHRAVPAANAAHLGVIGAMVLATAWVGVRRLTPDPSDQLLFLGALAAVMTLATPISHMHYYAFVLPLVAGVWYRGLGKSPGAIWPDRRTAAIVAAWALVTTVPLFPGPVFDRLRECGAGAAGTIALWSFGLWAVGRAPAAAAKPGWLKVEVRLAA